MNSQCSSGEPSNVLETRFPPSCLLRVAFLNPQKWSVLPGLLKTPRTHSDQRCLCMEPTRTYDCHCTKGGSQWHFKRPRIRVKWDKPAHCQKGSYGSGPSVCKSKPTALLTHFIQCFNSNWGFDFMRQDASSSSASGRWVGNDFHTKIPVTSFCFVVIKFLVSLDLPFLSTCVNK